MATERRVTKTRKDSNGDILALCNPGESWSPRKKNDAIKDIETGACTYYVQDSKGRRSDIEVVNDPKKGKYLRTKKDGSASNNLDNLPDC